MKKKKMTKTEYRAISDSLRELGYYYNHSNDDNDGRYFVFATEDYKFIKVYE